MDEQETIAREVFDTTIAKWRRVIDGTASPWCRCGFCYLVFNSSWCYLCPVTVVFDESCHHIITRLDDGEDVLELLEDHEEELLSATLDYVIRFEIILKEWRHGLPTATANP